ncbi:exported hypothetical protein [Exiguobacterium sp. 8H]|nr:exported hypothetical protein [Exiguobacterium sp. 8H]
MATTLVIASPFFSSPAYSSTFAAEKVNTFASTAKVTQTTAANEIIVYSFEELKQAITEDNGIDTIYIGSSFSVTEDIVMPYLKKNITIDGNGNTIDFATYQNTSTREYETKGFVVNDSRSGSSVYHLKNMKLNSSSVNGPFKVTNAEDVSLKFENIQSNGRVLAYNPLGRVYLMGNGTVVDTQSSSSDTRAIVSSSILEVSGDWDMVTNGRTSFYMYTGSTGTYPGKFILHSGADLFIEHTLNHYSANIFNTSVSDTGTITIDENASFVSKGSSVTAQTKPMRDVTIGKNAYVRVGGFPDKDLGGSTNAASVLAVSRTININENADVEINGPQPLQLYKYDATLNINNPKNFVLKGTGRFNAIAFSSPSGNITGNMNIVADSAVYWRGVPNVTAGTGLDYSKAMSSTGKIQMSAVYNGLTLKSSTGDESNWLPKSLYGTTNPDGSQGYPVFSVGSEKTLEVKQASVGTNVVAGTATPSADIRITYKKDGVTKSFVLKSDSNGQFKYTLPFQIAEGSTIDVLLVSDYRVAHTGETEAMESLEVIAQQSVDDLFTDENHNALAPTTDQGAIDDARAKVDALPEGDLKDELTNLVDVAQDLLDASNAVKDLADGSGVIKPGTDQKAIDDAKAKVDALPEGPQKEELTNQLEDMQKQLDDAEVASIQVLTFDEMTTKDLYARGTVSKNTVRVYIYLNDQLIRWRPVETDGSFYGHVSNTLKEGDKVTVVPVDEKGRRGTAKDIIVKADAMVGAPTLDTYVEGENWITGQTTTGTSYVRIYVNGELVRKRNVEADGSFYGSLYANGSPIAKVGDVITVIPYSVNDVAGKEATTIVQAKPVEIKTFVESDNTLYGVTTDRADKVDIYVNGKFLRTRAVEADGTFYGSMLINGVVAAKAGDTITVKARTDAGRVLAEGQTIVVAAEKSNPPKVNAYTTGDKELTGTVDTNVKRMRVYLPDGTAVNRGVIENGAFRVYVLDFGLEAGQTIKVVGILESGRETPATQITVK